MALSGSFYTNVNSHWRVYCSWSGTQSISGNYTDVTLKVYWQSIDSYGTTYTTATKNGTSTIYDYNSSGSDDTDSFTFSAKLDGQQSVLVHTQTVRVYHNSDGKKTFSMSASLSIELTLSGTYYGTVTASSGTVTLDTIPRKSTLTSSANWTAGNNLSITISPADSSFRHTVTVYVLNSSGSYVTVGSRSGIASSTTFTFTTAENTTIFQAQAQASSRGSKIRVETFSGSTSLGYNEYTGTCTNASASTVSIPDFNIGEYPTVTITRSNSAFTHNIYWSWYDYTTPTKTGIGTSTTLDNYNADTMYSKIPDKNSSWGTLYCETYYNGVLVRARTSDTANAYVVNANPIFNDGSIDYADTNGTTTGITGDPKVIIQNESDLTAYVNTSATTQKGATFSKYVVTVNGQQKDITTPTGSVTVGKITAGSDQTLTITVYDSRGNTASQYLNVKVAPYVDPALAVTLERQNKFENSTSLKVSGSFAKVTVNNADKNTIQSMVYRYKEKGASSYGSDQVLSYTTSNGTISVTTVILDLENTKAYDFQVDVQDKFQTKTFSATVGAGQPILFIDTVKKSVGVNQFPQGSNMFEVTGGMAMNGIPYAYKDISGNYSPVTYIKVADLPTSTTGTHDLLVIDIYGGGWNQNQSVHYHIELSARDALNVKFYADKQSSATLDRSNVVVYGNSVYLKLNSYVKGYVTAYFSGGGSTLNFGTPTTTVPSGTLAWSSETATPSMDILGNVTTTGDLTVGGGELTIAKAGTTSTIIFPAQTNDPAFIQHYENNNSAKLMFSVSDDANDTDYFAFGATQSGSWTEKAKITASGKGYFTDLYVNGVSFLSKGTLWSGAIYLMDSGTQTITPTKAITDCANGWILVWSDYNADTATAPDADFVYTLIPKNSPAIGKWHQVVIPSYSTSSSYILCVKQVGLSSTQIWGTTSVNASTNTGNQTNDVVLRYVLEW